jgi:hypothetical protein
MRGKNCLFWERGGQVENSGTNHPLPEEVPFHRPGGFRIILRKSDFLSPRP